jgi:ABC-2 type transport system ATP-binding protein
MLELRHVTKRFSGIPAVQDVSFTARPGEITGYLGPNGSGKSTTLKMITGLIDPTDGEILFSGEPIRRDRIAFKQRLGYVPEEPHLYSHLTGFEYLRDGRRASRVACSPARPQNRRISPPPLAAW